MLRNSFSDSRVTGINVYSQRFIINDYHSRNSCHRHCYRRGIHAQTLTSSTNLLSISDPITSSTNEFKYIVPVSPEVLFAEVSQRERGVELVLRVVALLRQEPVRVEHHHLIKRPACGRLRFNAAVLSFATNAQASKLFL